MLRASHTSSRVAASADHCTLRFVRHEIFRYDEKCYNGGIRSSVAYYCTSIIYGRSKVLKKEGVGNILQHLTKNFGYGIDRLARRQGRKLRTTEADVGDQYRWPSRPRGFPHRLNHCHRRSMGASCCGAATLARARGMAKPRQRCSMAWLGFSHSAARRSQQFEPCRW